MLSSSSLKLYAPQRFSSARTGEQRPIYGISGASYVFVYFSCHGSISHRVTQIYEFVRGTQLFDPSWNLKRSGMSATQTHLAQMAGLLGEFPQALLQRGEHTHCFFDEQGTYHSSQC